MTDDGKGELMSVAVCLGVDHLDSGPLKEASGLWSDWVRSDGRLGVVEELADLAAWTRRGQRDTDAVLRALAERGSPTGGDDAVAASVLAWLLVPGAVSIARSMADLSAAIDELVASHLWLCTRTFDWTRSVPVAATILRTTRRAVQAELGIGEGARRHDRTWSESSPFDRDATVWSTGLVEPMEPVAVEELRDLLDDAVGAGAITSDDRVLLVELAVATDRTQHRQSRRIPHRSSGGLLGRSVCSAVAARRGISPRTVSRRASRCLSVLSEFTRHRDALLAV